MIGNVADIVELFAYLYCMSALFGRKLKINIYVVVLSIIDMYLLSLINNYNFPKDFILISYVCIFIYALLYFGYGIKGTLINYFLTTVIIAIVQLMVFIPLYFIYYEKYEEIYINELLINIVCFIGIVLCDYIIKFKKISDFFIKKE